MFHGLAVRNTARFTPAVVRASPATTRHDWEIFRDLTTRLAARLDRKAPLADAARQRARMAASPRPTIIGAARRPGGSVDGDSCASTRRGSTSARSGRRCPGGCRPKDKRIDLAPPLVVGDLDRLRATLAEAPDAAAGELLLIGRRHKQDYNSWMHNTERLTRGQPRHQLLMHPDDLAERGIADGDRGDA